MLKKSIFNYFLEKLLSFPLSVKQIVFSVLLNDLRKYVSEDLLLADIDENFYNFRPQLTKKGEDELNERNLGFDQNIYSFLECCQNNLSITEISVNKFFTVEEITKFFIFSVEQELIAKTFSPKIKAMAGFLAGKYRIGEYFLNCGKITDEQIKEIVEIQRNTVQSGQYVMFAELLLQKGYISEKDIQSIFLLKSEANKRFFLDINTVSDFPASNENINAESTISILKDENDVLKKKLNQLLAYCMNDKENVK